MPRNPFYRDYESFWLPVQRPISSTTTGTYYTSNQILMFNMNVKTNEKEMPMPKETPETINNEFIKEYIDSDEWVTRLHAKLDTCIYDHFRFNTLVGPLRESMMDVGPSSMDVGTFTRLAQTSKKLNGKIYDQSFLRKCILDFLDKNDFIQLKEPRLLADRLNPYVFNKRYTVEAITKFNSSLTGKMIPVKALIPIDYVQVCPCCTETMISRDFYTDYQNLIQTTNSANLRFLNRLGNGQTMIPGNSRYYQRDRVSRFVCEPCKNSAYNEWFKCAGCNRFDQKSYGCAAPSNGRWNAGTRFCNQCFENELREQLFIQNALSFQPVELDIPTKTRYVGCEFECYVKPKQVLKFKKEHVFQVKHDGSLTSSGRGIPIEVVTQPLLTWRDEAIKSICKELESASVSVDNTCGGHIHVDSSGMNLNRQNMMRMRNLFRIYEAAFFAICNKNRLDNPRYCAPVPLDNQQGPQDSRYVSMNLVSLNSHNTIEFRCFDGSTDSEEWLSRIAFVEGFVNFAKDSLNSMIETTDMGVLSPLSVDSGYSSWNVLVDGYNWNRAMGMKEIISKNGPALINLAACRFKLRPSTISSLVKQFEKNWKT